MFQKLNSFTFSMGLILFLFQCTGTRPENLGLQLGKLTPCPITKNCVSSFAEPGDEIHFRSPVAFVKSVTDVKNILKSKIESMPRTNIIKDEPNYIYVEFTSALVRYVDDVEFYIDEKNKLLHFRSASRLGTGDWGVNRKRLDLILTDLDI